MNRRDQARRNIEARVYRDAMGEPPEALWKSLVPLLTEQGYASRILHKHLGLPTPLNTEDRRVMEESIFPYYHADAAFAKLLFVGCNTYTAHYQTRYFANKEYWTIEPDPTLMRFGSKHHVVGPLEEVAAHFEPDYFDLIICNGVFGWGLDLPKQCEAAFAQCHTTLRPGGHLVFGWDDIPRRTPFPLESVPSVGRFERFVFPPLGVWRYLSDTPYRHTFDFLPQADLACHGGWRAAITTPSEDDCTTR